MAYVTRSCAVCTNQFTPPHRANFLSTDGNHLTHCPSCRRLVKAAVENEQPVERAPAHHLAAPLKQVVFDLETWGLDRGWGVTMVGVFLIHGAAAGPEKHVVTLRDFYPWQEGRRSNDKDMVVRIFEILRGCHVAYAHNGDRFDMKWLRTVALKYDIEMPKLKLIDPCSIAWKKYLIGRNSLEIVSDFLGLERSKMHVPADVWRQALMDDDDEAWATLVTRCESDVDLLNEVAARVTSDIGMIDYNGSWR